jgi:hypothetical protein
MFGRVVRSLRARGIRGTWSVAPAALVEASSAALAAPIRGLYGRRIAAMAAAPIVLGPPLALSVMSFVQESDVPELVASVRSFLAHVGVPDEFVVVSDGTITKESAAVITSILPGVVSVQTAHEYVGAHRLPQVVRDFMAKSPWGAKLASIMALNDRCPAMYSDADLWYFAGAAELRNLVAGDAPLYLQDIAPYLDPRMLRDDSPGDDTSAPLNAGLLFVPKPLDWSLGCARLAELRGEPIGDSEQAAVHLTFLGARASPFPRSRYVINPRRSTPPLHVHARDLCVRHYTRPQRGLFWLRVARTDSIRLLSTNSSKPT